MKTVRIAELKDRLSHHLRSVRRGHSLVVLDRDTPIARLVPYRSEAGELVIHKAGRPFSEALKALKALDLGPPRPGIDPVALLLEDRRKR